MTDHKKPIIDIKDDISFIKEKVNNVEKNILELKEIFKDIQKITGSIVESIELKEVEDRRIHVETLKVKSGSWW